MTEHAHDELDRVDAGKVTALHDLLDAPGTAPKEGDPLPVLWHWLAFLPHTAQADLQPDGHPRLELVAFDQYPRRMFAGGRVRGNEPIRIGDDLIRVTTSDEPLHKAGRSGALAFVTLHHRTSVDGRTVVDEDQDLVYRPAPTQGTARAEQPQPAEIADDFTWRLDVVPDSRTLFRFSALTYNAHRIHYDHRYATVVEGHPDLVVHGPLQAIWLAELVRRNAPDTPVQSFEFRSVRPAYVDRTLHLRATRTLEAVELTAFDDQWNPTMRATAVLSPSPMAATPTT
jgi:3-methylfumaryl-CoA hydratase